MSQSPCVASKMNQLPVTCIASNDITAETAHWSGFELGVTYKVLCRGWCDSGDEGRGEVTVTVEIDGKRVQFSGVYFDYSDDV